MLINNVNKKDIFSYVTVLSNWILGYDKYSKRYSKKLINKSTYPNDFYLLKDDLSIGIDKAEKLLNKLSIKDNRVIRIDTHCDPLINQKNGIGYIIPGQDYIDVFKVYIKDSTRDELWQELSIEELTALSYKITNLKKYSELTPRSLSLLPIANRCQASCWFCFSESSISAVQDDGLVNFYLLDKICSVAKNKGAERFVITGGGEPTFLNFTDLIKVIETAKQYFDKIVLITNGVNLNNPLKLQQLEQSGLSVLSLSRHSQDDDINKKIMGINNKTTQILQKLNNINSKITKRLVCVLQKTGVHDYKSIEQYLDYASEYDVEQICFKELYVASQLESVYSYTKENKYCEDQQISLDIITSFCKSKDFKLINKLPWGSPVYRAEWNEKSIDIACYTEPSVGWERSKGICRSWNILSDSKVYASLEDLDSLINI